MDGWKEQMRKGGVEEFRNCAIVGSRNKEIEGGRVRESKEKETLVARGKEVRELWMERWMEGAI